MPCDESWIYCYDPETKRHGSLGKHGGSPKPKEARLSKSTHKLLMINFWQHWYDLHTLRSHWTDSQQGILCWGFKGVQGDIHQKRQALFKSGQWHFHQNNAPVHNSILVTDYLTKMGIKTVPHPPYSQDIAPCDFWLFPKLKDCRYETIEEMKEAVMKVIVMLTQEDFHGSFQKLLERCNKCIAAGGDYLEVSEVYYQ